MAIETNDDTARVTKEHVALSSYKAMIAVHAEAKTISAGRIWTLMHSILDEIEKFGAPYASTIEAARRVMDEHKAIDEMGYHLAVGCDVVPDCLDQIEMPLA